MKKWLEVKFNTIHKSKPIIIEHHPNHHYSAPNQDQDQHEASLPSDLAQQILEQEFICQSGDITNGQIAVLISLYTRAVEYFQGLGSFKYKLYQKRMETFLQKGSIDEFLRGHSVELARKKDQNDLEIRESRIKSIGEANRLMVEVEKKIDKQKQKVHRNIADQESSLTQRMKKRTTRSTTTSKTRAEDEQLESPYPRSLAISDHSPFSIDLEQYMKRPF